MDLVPENIGGERCPIVVHVVQTETGDDHDHAAARCPDDEAGLRDENRSPVSTAAILNEAGRMRRAGRRRYLVLAQAVAADAARPAQG